MQIVHCIIEIGEVIQREGGGLPAASQMHRFLDAAVEESEEVKERIERSACPLGEQQGHCGGLAGLA